MGLQQWLLKESGNDFIAREALLEVEETGVYDCNCDKECTPQVTLTYKSGWKFASNSLKRWIGSEGSLSMPSNEWCVDSQCVTVAVREFWVAWWLTCNSQSNDRQRYYHHRAACRHSQVIFLAHSFTCLDIFMSINTDSTKQHCLWETVMKPYLCLDKAKPCIVLVCAK